MRNLSTEDPLKSGRSNHPTRALEGSPKKKQKENKFTNISERALKAIRRGNIYKKNRIESIVFFIFDFGHGRY